MIVRILIISLLLLTACSSEPADQALADSLYNELETVTCVKNAHDGAVNAIHEHMYECPSCVSMHVYKEAIRSTIREVCGEEGLQTYIRITDQ